MGKALPCMLSDVYWISGDKATVGGKLVSGSLHAHVKFGPTLLSCLITTLILDDYCLIAALMSLLKIKLQSANSCHAHLPSLTFAQNVQNLSEETSLVLGYDITIMITFLQS